MEEVAKAMREKKVNWSRRIAWLRQDADAGDVAALRDLGLTLLDGIQDQRGRSVVRRNPAYAVRLLRRAVDNGDTMAAASLGYAYGAGKGVPRNSALAVKWNRRAAEQGEIIAMANLGAEYRKQGNLRLAPLEAD